jgi:hypothetical protein
MKVEVVHYGFDGLAGVGIPLGLDALALALIK